MDPLSPHLRLGHMEKDSLKLSLCASQDGGVWCLQSRSFIGRCLGVGKSRGAGPKAGVGGMHQRHPSPQGFLAGDAHVAGKPNNFCVVEGPAMGVLHPLPGS